MVVLAPVFAVHALIEHQVVRERMDPFDRAASSTRGPALLFIKGRVGTMRSMAAEHLTRNGTTYSGRVLYALDRGVDEDCQTLMQFKGRSGYLYMWDAANRSGSLRQIACTDEEPRTTDGLGTKNGPSTKYQEPRTN